MSDADLDRLGYLVSGVPTVFSQCIGHLWDEPVQTACEPSWHFVQPRGDQYSMYWDITQHEAIQLVAPMGTICKA